MEFKNKNGSILQEIGRNINEEVKNGQIDPIIGRDAEIRKTIEILSRKQKSNPVLIGEPGVGKTAVVEGLATRIVHREVPSNLLDKVIYEISITSLLSGTMYMGSLEEKMQKLIKEVKEAAGSIILFIDEIHMIVGAGKNGMNNMDISNMLKPLLARGELKLIGATTYDEYSKYIESDGALERRLTKVMIKEPSELETLTIMRGLKSRWETYHGIKIHDSALVAATKLSIRYINDRNLPDKAIDLVDQAAAKLKTDMNSSPVFIEDIKKDLVHLQMEKIALEQENDEKSKQRILEIKKLINEKNVVIDKYNEELKKEKTIIDNLKKKRQELELKREKSNILINENRYEEASKILYLDIPKMEREVSLLETEYQSTMKDKILSDSLTEKEIATVVSERTGVPVANLLTKEKEKLLTLAKRMKEEVIGQDEAIDKIVAAVQRSRAGISNPDAPIGTFLFLGSTGVGKTMVAKVLAKNLFDSEKTLIRFDMSEFMEKHSVSKLIGTPPGYVGYEEKGALTEAIKRQPYSIILFDEIEKAHNDVLNILLQILDEGRLTDNHKKEINFKNTIIIMTSNIGHEAILENNRDKVIKTLNKTLKPELINRINDVIIFNPLDKEGINRIIANQLHTLVERVKENEYLINFSDKIINYINSNAYSYTYGARAIKRFITSNIENQLALLIIKGDLKKDHWYQIDIDEESRELIVNDETLV
ncbi:ATP-dependent Clp protease ATP-binding subunit [Ureaplasma canigenitalium]|uniref:ATP-dependent Clp protease ATP-binding subunit n=1 Tax=Ureaplasma canigenitalium TaxID=42092 RepID=UPI0004E23E8A|nr:AAA family ATPase [Ureaplasma canigenitalium]